MKNKKKRYEVEQGVKPLPSLASSIFGLGINDAIVVPKHLQACAHSIIYYYRKRNKLPVKSFKIRTQKKAENEIYVIRIK